MSQHHRAIGAALLASTFLTAPALAQGATTGADQSAQAAASGQAGNVLQEVVVTAARKRKESVQTTPIAITALSAHALEQAHITNFSQIGDLAPNFQMVTSLGASGLANIYLRGFGQQTNNVGTDPHVAIFVDGIYQPSPVGALFDTFDLGQVEVDAGPQGTLLGKNAPIGAVYVTSKKPTDKFGGEVEGDYGSYDHFGLRGVVNLPLVQNEDGTNIFAARVALTEKEGGNWVYNIANGKYDMGGENSKSGRVALAFTPNSEFEWDVNAFVALDRNPQHGEHPMNFVPGQAGTSSSALQTPAAPCAFAGLCTAYPYGTTDSTFTTRESDDAVNIASNMSYRFDPATLTYVSGFNSFYLVDNLDDAGTPFVALNAYRDVTRYDFESQELRLASNKGGGWDLNGLVDWVIGGYFSNHHYYQTDNLGLGAFQGFTPGIGFPIVHQGAIGVTQSEALYVHTIFNFTDQWKGTFGVRQSWDHKNNSYQPTATSPFFGNVPAGWHNTSFEAGTSYQFDPSHMAYFRFAQGYESGGFSDFGPNDPYNEELNNSFEIGFKSDWLNHRLRANFDLFTNELSQLQLESALAVPTSVSASGFLQETLNAGSATVQGMEAQLVAVPVEDLTTHLNLGYLRTKFNQNNSTTCSNTAAPSDCGGLPFAYSPKWTINFGADYLYELPHSWGSLTFSGDWDYRSTLYTEDPVYPFSKQNGYGLVDLGVTYNDPTDTYSLEFYGTNVLDRHYMTGFTDPSFGPASFAAWEQQGAPAMWGMRLTYKFGEQ